MTSPLKTTLLALATLCLLAGGSRAQANDPQARDAVDRLLPPAPPITEEEARPQAEADERDTTERRVTRALNDEIVSRNRLAENQERADRETYEQKRARYQLVIEQATRDRLA